MRTSNVLLGLLLSSAAVGCAGENLETDVVDTDVAETDVVDTDDTEAVDTDDTDVVDTDDTDIAVDTDDTDVVDTDDTDVQDPDADADGYTAGGGDCNDGDAAVNPGATEVCNGLDDNCDESTDEGLLTTFHEDADGDGFGGPNTQLACTAPGAEWVEDGTDCEDSNDAVNPSATDTWNHVDDDCDGDIDPGIVLVNTLDDVTADDGLCSVREAIVAANTDTASGVTPGECRAGGVADIIEVPPGIYIMADGLLDLGDGVSVVGSGGGQTLLAGGSAFELELLSGAELNDCDVDGGSLTVRAGAIAQWGADGQVTLSGTLTNEGGMTGGDGLVVDAGSIENAEGAWISAYTLELISAADVINDGEVTAQDGLVAEVAGGFLNRGTRAVPLGTVVSHGNIDIFAATVINNGAMDADVDITIDAGSITNTVFGGDDREWYQSASTPNQHNGTYMYYDFPDDYEIQYWTRTYTMTQRYAGDTPAFTPNISCQGALTWQNFDVGTNIGGVLAADALYLDATQTGTFTNNELELSEELWTVTWEVYTHWIALGPAMYDDHIIRNEESTHNSSVLSDLGAGLDRKAHV